jgi:hypothetical protein
MNELEDEAKALDMKEDPPKGEDAEQALAQLSLLERSCLLLAAEGFAPGEIAEILNVGSERIVEATRRGREKFLLAYRALLAEQGWSSAVEPYEDAQLIDTLIRNLPETELPPGPPPQLLHSWESQKRESSNVPLVENGSEVAGSLQPVADSYVDENQHTLVEKRENENSPLEWKGAGLEAQKTSTLLAPSRESYIGKRFGNYILVRRIGEGSFTSVYLGRHIQLGTSAAIKVLHTQFVDESIRQFRTEACRITRLEHPHLVRVLDFGIQGSNPFLITEYAPNGSLRELHPKGSRLSLATVVSYARQVSDALQYIHNQGFIHQDVKPENLLLGANNQVLLADFGIATLVPRKYEMPSSSVWKLWETTTYIAPEQFQGVACSASDQYALGMVIYEWLTGASTLQGSSAATESILGGSPGKTVPKLAPAIERVILKALRKQPESRFQSVSAFVAALERIGQPKPMPVAATWHRYRYTQQSPSRRKKRRAPPMKVVSIEHLLQCTVAYCTVAVFVRGAILILLCLLLGKSTLLLLAGLIPLVYLANTAHRKS